MLRRVLKGAWADFRASLGRDEPPTPVVADGPSVTGSPPPDAEQPLLEPAPLEPQPAGREATRPFWRRHGLTTVLASALAAFVGWWYLWPLLGPVEPSDPNVVAVFADGVVTKEELIAELERYSEGDRRALADTASLRHLVEDMVVHRVAERWAQERRLEDKSSVQHALKHVAEDVKLADIGRQVHEGQIRVDEWEIQQYYDQNRERFADTPLAQAREAIRETLHSAKERSFVDEYLRSLRQSASVTLDESLLQIGTPSEADLVTYYQARQNEFREPDRRQVQELLGTKDQAEQARARVVAGEDFASVAKESSGSGWREDGKWVARGTRSETFEENVWPLRDGEVSPVFQDDGAYRVVKVTARRSERQRPFDEVREEIAGRLIVEQTARQDEANRDKTLFTIRGRRFTLGEFLDEFAQLPPEVQNRYRAPEARRRLLDNLIDRLVLLDGTSAQLPDAKNQREIEDARRHLLAQALHVEQMQDSVTASEDEVRRFYEAHRSHYVEQAKVRISYAWIDAGTTADSRAAAQAKIAAAEWRIKESGNTEEAFVAVAREFSEDAATATQGGRLDRWLAETDDPLTHALSHNLLDAIFRLKPGEVSPVVFANNGYYLVRMRERTEAQPLSFEQAKERVREDLLAQKHARAVRALDDELFRRMQLTIFDRRLGQVLNEAGLARAK